MPVTPSPQIISELAPTGALRAAINMGNFLLVTGKDAVGRPDRRVARHGGGDRGAARRAGQVRAV